jgi:hypothetical protein
MTLSHLHDVIYYITALIGGEDEPYLGSKEFSGSGRDVLKQLVEQNKAQLPRTCLAGARCLAGLDA